MPAAAQHLPMKTELTEDKTIDLDLYQCSGCGLVQSNCEPVDYYRDVIRSGGYSSTMHQLRHEQYQRFLDTCPVAGKRVIEVGCGQGEFLGIWEKDGFPVEAVGVEHDAALVEKARQAGLHVFQAFTESENDLLPGAPFDAFCSFNFLEHQPYPNDMLRCIYNNLSDEAYGLITVPSWEYIVEKESYYELIRDHLAYYDERTFRFALEKNGFHVLDMRIVNRDTWEAIVEKRKSEDVSALNLNMKRLKEEMSGIIDELEKQKKKIAIWGASHQGLTIMSSMELDDKVAYMIDSAPFKQGKFAAGSHIPIVPMEHFQDEPVDVILIIAPGYTDEIANLIKTHLDRNIRIMVLRGNHIEEYEERKR